MNLIGLCAVSLVSNYNGSQVAGNTAPEFSGRDIRMN